MTETFRQDPMGVEFEPQTDEELESIFIAIPNLGKLSTFLVNILIRWFMGQNYNIKLYTPCEMIPHSKARNTIHREFMNSGYDWLLTIDADVVPPVDALRGLMSYVTDEEVERHYVALTVQMSKMTEKGAMLAPSAFNYDANAGGYVIAQGEGLTQVDIATLACTIRSRELMDAVGAGVYAERPHGEYKNRTTGEDFVFGEKVLELVRDGHEEYKPWVDYNHICSHYVTTNTRALNDLLLKAESSGKQEANSATTEATEG